MLGACFADRKKAWRVRNERFSTPPRVLVVSIMSFATSDGQAQKINQQGDHAPNLAALLHLTHVPGENPVHVHTKFQPILSYGHLAFGMRIYYKMPTNCVFREDRCYLNLTVFG